MFTPPPSQTFCFLSVLGLASFPWLLAMPGNASPAQRPDIQLFQTGKAWSELLQPLPVIGCCCVSTGPVCPFHGSEGHLALITSSARGTNCFFIMSEDFWSTWFSFSVVFFWFFFFFHWGRRWGKLKGILPSLELLGFWGWLFCLGMSMVKYLCWDKP